MKRQNTILLFCFFSLLPIPFVIGIFTDGAGLGALWASVTSGGTTTSVCTSGPTSGTVNCAGGGVVPAGDFLWFNPGAWAPRQATTIPIPVPAGGTIIFEFKIETQSAPGCDGPDLLNEGIMI